MKIIALVFHFSFQRQSALPNRHFENQDGEQNPKPLPLHSLERHRQLAMSRLVRNQFATHKVSGASTDADACHLSDRPTHNLHYRQTDSVDERSDCSSAASVPLQLHF